MEVSRVLKDKSRSPIYPLVEISVPTRRSVRKTNSTFAAPHLRVSTGVTDTKAKMPPVPEADAVSKTVDDWVPKVPSPGKYPSKSSRASSTVSSIMTPVPTSRAPSILSTSSKHTRAGPSELPTVIAGGESSEDRGECLSISRVDRT